MLVLTRRVKESIMIGDEIEVSVVRITGGKVRIAIEAPKSIPVFRKEIYLDIQRVSDLEAVEEALDRLKSP